MEFRSESKFMVSRKDLLVLKYKLKDVVPYDSYCNGKTYNVRTIYFDSIDNKCFYDNADGLDQRYKLRIRMYNRSINDIKLECKYKEMGNTKKVYCKINKKLCNFSSSVIIAIVNPKDIKLKHTIKKCPICNSAIEISSPFLSWLIL